MWNMLTPRETAFLSVRLEAAADDAVRELIFLARAGERAADARYRPGITAAVADLAAELLALAAEADVEAGAAAGGTCRWCPVVLGAGQPAAAAGRGAAVAGA